LTAGPKAFSETVPAGKIISTDPTAGAEATVGDTVVATVSRGPERYAVPDVTGSTVKDATAALTDGGLTVADKTISAYDDKIDEGLVVSTKPKIGAELRPGTAVTLRVSKGPAPVPVPSGLVGKPASSAEKALGKVGLKAETSQEYSTSVKAGHVISTDPSAGTPVPYGGSVGLVVSQGPPPVKVPSMFTKSADSAVKILSDLGLVPKITYPKDSHPFTLVYGQSINGATVPAGTTVVLYVF
jgi:serine/threonine-protein kinase